MSRANAQSRESSDHGAGDERARRAHELEPGRDDERRQRERERLAEQDRVPEHDLGHQAEGQHEREDGRPQPRRPHRPRRTAASSAHATSRCASWTAVAAPELVEERNGETALPPPERPVPERVAGDAIVGVGVRESLDGLRGAAEPDEEVEGRAARRRGRTPAPRRRPGAPSSRCGRAHPAQQPVDERAVDVHGRRGRVLAQAVDDAAGSSGGRSSRRRGPGRRRRPRARTGSRPRR